MSNSKFEAFFTAFRILCILGFIIFAFIYLN